MRPSRGLANGPWPTACQCCQLSRRPAAGFGQLATVARYDLSRAPRHSFKCQFVFYVSAAALTVFVINTLFSLLKRCEFFYGMGRVEEKCLFFSALRKDAAVDQPTPEQHVARALRAPTPLPLPGPSPFPDGFGLAGVRAICRTGRNAFYFAHSCRRNRIAIPKAALMLGESVTLNKLGPHRATQAPNISFSSVCIPKPNLYTVFSVHNL